VNARSWPAYGALLTAFAACDGAESHSLPRDLFVYDVASADLTADGVSDFVVEALAGNERNFYVLDGATDVDFVAEDVLQSWSSRTKSFGAKRSIIVPAVPDPLLVAVGPEPQGDNDGIPSTLVVAFRLRDLTPLWAWVLPPAYLGAPWLNVVTHNDRAWLYAGSGYSVSRIPVDVLADETKPEALNAPMEVVPPPTPMTDWDGVVAAMSVGQDGLAIVTYKSVLKNANAERLDPSAWSQVRDEEYWEPQTLMDLDGDGHDEIVGFDIVGSKLCAVDLERSTLGCISVPPTTSSVGTTLSSVLADTTGPSRDVLLIRPVSAANGTALNRADLFRSLAFQGPSLNEASHGVTQFEWSGLLHVVPITRGMLSSTFLLLRTNGEATCISPSTVAVEGCDE
jgi:hypothetical protein